MNTKDIEHATMPFMVSQGVSLPVSPGQRICITYYIDVSISH